tara:strand:+ start:928 stop:1185 length:258 start_codon:yes stop_codon:yes gene_type:complete
VPALAGVGNAGMLPRRRKKMKVGDLVKFGNIYNGCELNQRLAIYLGEAFIYRSDGVTVENHKVLVIGETEPITIDRGLLRYMRVH